MKTMLMRLVMAALCAALGGCASTPEERDARREAVAEILDVALATYSEWDESRNQTEAPSVAVPQSAVWTSTVAPVFVPHPSTNIPAALAHSADFTGLKFRNSADCRDWKITASVSGVGFRGGNITWSEGAGSRAGWNQKSSGGKTINSECILLIPSIGAAGMFDYARVGQREKILSNLAPSHEGPGFFPGWVPKKGERVGFCLATISRDRGAAKMQERSNVVWIEWPRDGL